MPKHDAIALLEQDHHRIRALFARLGEAGEDDGAGLRIIRELATEIQHHTMLEEEIFYPAFRDAVRGKAEERLFFQAIEEHNLVDQVLPEVEKDERATPRFLARCAVLENLLMQHIEMEESRLFPLVARLLDEAQLRELGEALEERHDRKSDAAQGQAQPGSGAGAAGSRKVNINSADPGELGQIPGIDETRAEKLVRHRDEHGPFRSWDDIREVEGFGGAMIRQLQEAGTLGHS